MVHSGGDASAELSLVVKFVLGLCVGVVAAYAVFLGLAESAVPGMVIGGLMVGPALVIKADGRASESIRRLLVGAGVLVLAPSIVKLLF